MNHRRDSTSSDASMASCSSVSRIPISRTPVLPRRQRSASSTLERHRSLQSLHRPHSTTSSQLRDDDSESLRSGISCCSSTGNCDHAPFARNGTTWSGRGHRYIVHCSPTSSDPGKYQTPTQRAHSTIRRLESLVNESQTELREKEKEIARLTRELVELRFGKVELDDIDETEATKHGHENENGHLDSSTPVKSRQRLNVDAAVSVVDVASGSLGDSGHFDDISPAPSPRCTPNGHNSLETKTNDDKIDVILQRLAEANERYFELRPQYDQLQEKLRELEKEKEILESKFKESEERHKQTYLQMFNKGQEAALFDVDQSVPDGPARGIPQLLKELEVTKAELESVKTMYRRLLETKKTKSEQEAEVTLQFLKSAFYYFLTDRENTSGHLAAIQSILGFSQEEKQAIEKASYAWK